jgi:hypothetical protein
MKKTKEEQIVFSVRGAGEILCIPAFVNCLQQENVTVHAMAGNS